MIIELVLVVVVVDTLYEHPVAAKDSLSRNPALVCFSNCCVVVWATTDSRHVIARTTTAVPIDDETIVGR